MSLGKILNEKKTIEILQALQEKPTYVRSLQRAIGGSMSTIVSRVNTLIQAGLISETEPSQREKHLELTERGKALVRALDWLETTSRKSDLTLNKPRKWILALLYILREIRGSTRLEKLLFLLKEQFKVTGDSFYEFEPYLFGPFSAEVLEDAKALGEMDLINISRDTIEVPPELSDAFYVRKTYSLTDKGKEEAEKCYREITVEDGVKESIYRLKAYNSMPLSMLLNYVYENFPDYSPPPELP